MNKIIYPCKGIVNGLRCDARWGISEDDLRENDPKRMICAKCKTLVDKDKAKKLLDKNKN